VLLRLAYPVVTNTFALLRLLPMSDHEKDVEILALRHQITALEGQLNGQRVRFRAVDRALLASLLQGLPREALRRIRSLVRPGTALRRHRDMLAHRHAASQPSPKRGGRPRPVHSIRTRVLRPAKENPNRGYRRLHSELLVLGVKAVLSRSSPPPPSRSGSTSGSATARPLPGDRRCGARTARATAQDRFRSTAALACHDR
jgi:putative transposase